jgi:hypothetical protein
MINNRTNLKTKEKYDDMKLVVMNFDLYLGLDFLRTLAKIYKWHK